MSIQDTSSRDKWKVFAPVPPGGPASEEFVDLWRSISLPSTDTDLENELLKRNLLSRSDLRARAARRKEQKEDRGSTDVW